MCRSKRQMVAACYTEASTEGDIHSGNKHFFTVDTAVGACCLSHDIEDKHHACLSATPQGPKLLCLHCFLKVAEELKDSTVPASHPRSSTVAGDALAFAAPPTSAL